MKTKHISPPKTSIVASRWIQAPQYFGLIIVQIVFLISALAIAWADQLVNETLVLNTKANTLKGEFA